MFCLFRPSSDALQGWLQSRREAPYSYAEVGATRGELPAGYVVDHRQIQLGQGATAFESARRAVRQWKMFDLSWVQIAPPQTPTEEGQVVAVVARAAGLWAVGTCRIVYVIDEPRRFGFAYGTLAHAEQGEERFLIEWRDDDTVWYDLLAFSRPGSWLTRLAYPYARYCQRAFGLDSLTAMRRAVELGR